jgi:uncharacterized membrane protein YfcA
MEYWVIPLAMLLGGFVQSASGFGGALVAMPMLVPLLGLQVAAPMQVLLGLVTDGMVLHQNRQGFSLRTALDFIVPSMLGIPIGLAILKFGAPSMVIPAMGLLLIAYALYQLLIAGHVLEAEFRPLTPRARRGAWLAGFAGGVLGGAYTTSGPPLIIYGDLQRWPRLRFRSILQTVFIVNDSVLTASYFALGMVTSEVWRCVALGLPALLLGIFLGGRSDRVLPQRGFRVVVLLLLLALGASLIYSGVKPTAN